MTGKLCPEWMRPFCLTNVYPNGAVEVHSLETEKRFKVSGHRLKLYHERDFLESFDVAYKKKLKMVEQPNLKICFS